MNNITTTAETALNWNGEKGIVCPILARNLPDTPASFKKYSHEDVIKISKLDLFFIFFLLMIKNRLLFHRRTNS